MSVTLIVDLLLIAFLAATIAAAVVLRRRLDALRGDHDRLDALAARFVEATGRAEDGIGRLKVATETLEDRIKAAEAMASDLRFLADEANRAADRAEAGVRALRPERARAAPPPPAAPGPAAEPRAPAPAATPRRQTEAERALLHALARHEARGRSAA